jgi:hypothetical protein
MRTGTSRPPWLTMTAAGTTTRTSILQNIHSLDFNTHLAFTKAGYRLVQGTGAFGAGLS